MISPQDRVVCLKQCTPEPNLNSEQYKALIQAGMKIEPIQHQIRTYGQAVKRWT